eukprot:CAMPEP_0184532920 /NCGR_PEP_ID=MMETSP0198_2-20121128/14444_1 /TAXON_ID=1112570 /ORGANISM="Thraustochytrium sp., Strain LLF1b" /LENGTH=245 /DNA_ID=CAMNT_0026925589 /DNA_START=237 /DNA_END=974 /DNA_ORIENTATION=+
MRVVAIIPARWGSTRFPGKPLALLQGRPMITHTLRRVQLVPGLDKVIVATDDVRIAREVEAAGGEAVMTPSSCVSGTDRVLAACNDLALSDNDVVVNVQGDEPHVDPLHVELLTSGFLAQSVSDMGTLAVEEPRSEKLENSNLVKVVTDTHGSALYFSRLVIPYAQQKCEPDTVLRHIGLYAFRFGFLKTFAALPWSRLEHLEGLEQLRALEAGHKIRVFNVQGPVFPGIDTPEQLAEAERRPLS